jgi:hypothetical protein
MPVADFKTYCAILDDAREGHFALPTVNVTSLTYLALAEVSMAEHVKQAVHDLRGAGKTMYS